VSSEFKALRADIGRVEEGKDKRGKSMAQAVLKNKVPLQPTETQEISGVPQFGMEIVQAWPARRLWTREEYNHAYDAGIFRPEERLELIGGEIFIKMTQNGPHATAILLLQRILFTFFVTGFQVRIQLPLALGDSNQPEPDFAIVAGSDRDYVQHHPSTAALIVEISDSTLASDRKTKASLYAQAGIVDYWVLNLTDRVLEVYRDPAPLSGYPFGHYYRSITTYPDTASIAPLAAPEHAIAVADMLP
jgi:Uma2 family endonuclease